jgi:hypothetical protein
LWTDFLLQITSWIIITFNFFFPKFILLFHQITHLCWQELSYFLDYTSCSSLT